MTNTFPNLVLSLPSHFEDSLKNTIPSAEARAIAKLVMEELTCKQMVDLLADTHACWTNDQQKRINKIIDALKQNEPIQYILGFGDFMDLRFRVSPGVLIPRGETEELITWIIGDLTNNEGKEVGEKNSVSILDVGCGSGIIGVCLAKELPDARLTCADLYQKPLEITRENAIFNEVDIEVKEMDALNPSDEWMSRSFDVIVSNPPYVMNSQKASMQANVLRNEPESALFVSDEEALIFYQNICEYASHSLADGGSLYFEINDQLGNETKSLVQTYFRTVELKKDIHGKDRMIKAYDGH